MRKLIILFTVLFAVIAATLISQEIDVFSVLKSTVTMGRQNGGYYLLPTNQLLRPWGRQMLIPGRPVDLAFDSQQRLLAVLNWRGVLLLDASTGIQLAQVRSRSTSYAGVAFRPGDREVWASEATRNGPDGILVAKLSDLGLPDETERIALPGHPVPTGIAFSTDGKTAYVAFSRNNSVAVFDAGTRELKSEIPVGMAPFAVVLSPNSGKLYVSNRGGRRPSSGETLSATSGSEVVSDPETGAASTGTVTVINLEDLSTREVAVGLAPSGIALSSDEKILVVANGHSDSISFVDTQSLTARELKIPTWPEGTFGSQPIAAAFSPDGKTVYVACGGNNAVAVVTSGDDGWKVAGALPTGWFPSALAVDREGTLRVINIKGVGNTANDKGTFNSREYEGSLLKIPAPDAGQMAAGQREVLAANMPKFEPNGGIEDLSSLGIRYVFLIIKENRTYDQVFGDVPKGNGDPGLVMYGNEVTPNHHALAERYVLLDNFYTSSAISFDGHHWLMQGFVSDYVERAFAASPRGYAYNMSDALTVSPAGFFWQGAPRPLKIRIHGELCLPARWDPVKQNAVDMDESGLLSWGEYWKVYKEGKWQAAVGARSAVPALARFTNPRYPNQTLNIPDQIRAEEFIRDLAEREKSGEMPNLSVMSLNDDHTAGTRPGFPTPRAMVADNDLALGRVVEAISKSRFWPNSLILVTEDDAQNGVDHVDGHRTIGLAIGPHVRRDAVDSNHYNHGSMIRTIQEIFRVPSRTRFLRSARAMNSIFTAQADVTPYKCLTPKVPLDEMNPQLKALRGRRLWAARQSLGMNWADIDDVPEELLNRILWWDAKGYDTPFPRRGRGPANPVVSRNR
jgi:YVTN family beta-propeller protein